MSERYIIETRRVGINGELTRWVILDTATPRTGESCKRFPHTVVSTHRTAAAALDELTILERAHETSLDAEMPSTGFQEAVAQEMYRRLNPGQTR